VIARCPAELEVAGAYPGSRLDAKRRVEANQLVTSSAAAEWCRRDVYRIGFLLLISARIQVPAYRCGGKGKAATGADPFA
jgi:hypothetical protein